MVQCPICGETFDTERGMKIHKGRKHSEEEQIDDNSLEEQRKELREELEGKQEKWYRQWRPEIAIITLVGILGILILTAATATTLSRLDRQITPAENETTVFVPSDVDQELCGVTGMRKIIYCENATVCAPQEDEDLKIIAAHQPGEETSIEQRKILNNLMEDDDSISVKYVCVEDSEIPGTCEDQEWGIPFDEWEASEYYTFREFPALIMNCEYRRTGTYSTANPEREEEELEQIIQAFKDN